MWRRILGYGALAGLIVGVPIFGTTVVTKGHVPEFGLALGYTIMLIALSAEFLAIKQYRDLELGGVIGFWRALGLGLGVSIVAGIFYVVAWEAAVAYAHLDFAAAYARATIAHAQARGVSGAALARLVAEMDQFKASYANPLYRFGMTFAEIFPVGVLVSLVSAGLLSQSRFLPARKW